MGKDFKSLALKSDLRKRNADTSGKKDTLNQRFKYSDECTDGLLNDPEVSYQMEDPAPLHFEYITSDTRLPYVSLTDLHNYSVLAKSEDLIMSKNMYDENCLLSCSFAKDPNENIFHVTALCCSLQSENVHFNIEIKIRDDVIVHGQCECINGTGPYAQCKHVMVLIYGLIDLSLNRRINTHTYLQQSAEDTNDPMRVENLLLKLKKDTSYDPRSLKSRNKVKFIDNFKKTIFNYCNKYGIDMPIAQLVRPVNPRL